MGWTIPTGSSKHTGRDTLDSATTRKTTDSRLGYTLDVVTKNLPVTFRSALSETLSTFAAYVDPLVTVLTGTRCRL